MIALLHMCGQKQNENIRMQNDAKYNSAQHTIALQNKKNATNWNQTRKSWLCTTPQEQMINNKFDFINVILPPKHYKKCEIIWKTKKMRKRNLHNGTQQINTASITTMRTNQTIINYETHFHAHIVPLARNQKWTHTEMHNKQCETSNKTMTEILMFLLLFRNMEYELQQQIAQQLHQE